MKKHLLSLRHRLFEWAQSLLLIPKQPESKLIGTIHCKKEDLENRFGVHHLTAQNPIRVLNPAGYFRECRKHERVDVYLQKAASEFFYEILPLIPNMTNRGGYKSDYQRIIELFRNRSIIDKFLSMGSSADLNSPLMRFHKKGEYNQLGLETIQGAFDDDLIHTFVWYMRSHVDAYKSARFGARNKWQTYFASRGVATYQFSRLLKLEGMIPETRYVNLEVENGRSRFGSFMDVAEGVHYDNYCKSDALHIITPALQRSLLMLNLLDCLTYEKDHRLNNYNVVTDKEGYATGVCAYDNDSPLVFFFSPSPSFTTYAGCSPIINNGMINRPYMDRDLAKRILCISSKDIRQCLNPYCNSLQLWALCKRMKAIQSAIIKTVETRPDFLLEEEQWNSKTVQEELSGKYGKTYLSLINSIYK